MSTRSCLTVGIWVIALAGCASPATRETPNLGRVASPSEVAAWDLSIPPDGTGLPPGRGSSGQGAIVYEQKCQNCHGERGAGQPNDRLVGGHGTLASKSPVRTVGSYWPYATTVFDYVRRAMPYTQSHSLSDDEVYAVTAYLLHLNGIIGESDVMNAETLPRVKMPNRDQFILAYPTKPK
jgi:mono/diheme cytochrome c family protein